MCLFTLVIMHLAFISIIFWLLPLWPPDQWPTAMPCIHDPPSSHCIAAVYPAGIKEILFWVSTSLFPWGCLFINPEWSLSSLLHPMGGLQNQSWKYISWWSVKQEYDWLGNLRLISANLIHNKKIYISISLIAFFSQFFWQILSMLLFVNCLYGYTIMIPCDICKITFRIFQISLKQSLCLYLKLFYLAAPYSEKINLHVFIRLQYWTPPPVLWPRICCGNLQYKDNSYY